MLSAILIALQVIGYGAGLGFGLWLVKKLTNKIDEFLYCCSSEFKQLVLERS